MSDAKKSVAGSKEAQGEAQGDLEVTNKDLAEDTKTLAELHRECMARSEDFEGQAKSRAAEMKGLAIAKKAIQGIQLRNQGRYEWRSFLQTSGADASASRKVISKLRSLARRKNDTLLAQIASRMSATVATGGKAGEDIFAELKQQMMDSIKKLEEEEA